MLGLHRLRLGDLGLGFLALLVLDWLRQLGGLGCLALLVAHLNTCDSAKCMT